MSVWFLSLSVYVYGIYGIATVVEGKYELKRSKRHKFNNLFFQMSRDKH